MNLWRDILLTGSDGSSVGIKRFNESITHRCHVPAFPVGVGAIYVTFF